MCQIEVFRSSHRRCSVRKGVLRNFAKFTGKHLCQGFLFNKVAGLVAKQLYWNRTSAWVFRCKFAAYFEDTFSQEHLWMTASTYRSYQDRIQKKIAPKIFSLFQTNFYHQQWSYSKTFFPHWQTFLFIILTSP